ncbi:hypothetical protein CN958_30350 [Bacillus cereus]|uniref:Uncharacterized protein n=1 Tax=Bacillus cereus TaxID=1396 RepID=A0A2B9DHR5_BACCE|nr:hypothetical protein CN958_30350 [Bacillus cereus]
MKSVFNTHGREGLDLSRYLRAVRQYPAEAKKIGLLVKARLVRANNQRGMDISPLIKVSLYLCEK